MWLAYLQSFGTVHFFICFWISLLVEFEVFQEGRIQWKKCSGKEHTRGDAEHRRRIPRCCYDRLVHLTLRLPAWKWRGKCEEFPTPYPKDETDHFLRGGHSSPWTKDRQPGEGCKVQALGHMTDKQQVSDSSSQRTLKQILWFLIHCGGWEREWLGREFRVIMKNAQLDWGWRHTFGIQHLGGWDQMIEVSSRAVCSRE